MRNLWRFWRTIRRLTARQLVYQLIVRIRAKPRLRYPLTIHSPYFLTVPKADKPVSWQAGTFTFLHKAYTPPSGPVDWNYRYAGPTDQGKLWTYHLNYFDFLNQPSLPLGVGLILLHDFIHQTNRLREGLESYPISLRTVNWIQFLSRHKLNDQGINGHLFAQLAMLSRRLEYHIGGNHLLENGYALLMGSLFFRRRPWLRKAIRLVSAELTTQILADGGHDERSPMYQALLLDRTLTVLLALQHDTWHGESDFADYLATTARQMLAWLMAITFRNGDVPMVNDAAAGMAPSTAQLRAKAASILKADGGGQDPISLPATLKESGYRMFRTARYELVADIGPPGADHQPGHAHADTLGFLLYADDRPVLVDTGTSTYQPGSRRDLERSTAAHNTVDVRGRNSSEVWAGFRVGRRAAVTVLMDTETELKARHDGYRPLGVLHERQWAIEPARLLITDRLIPCRKKADLCGVARFHFHPDVQVQLLADVVMAGPLQLLFASATKPICQLTTYAMAEGFNRLRTGTCLEVLFAIRLETVICLRS